MPKKVLKRDGREEDFQLLKLKTSLEKASRQANYQDDKIFRVVEDISEYVLTSTEGLETVDTKSMRTLILNKLDEVYPEVSAAWRKYDREVKGREE